MAIPDFSSDDDCIVRVSNKDAPRSVSEPPSPEAKRPRIDRGWIFVYISMLFSDLQHDSFFPGSASSVRYQSAFRPEYALQVWNPQVDNDPFPYKFEEFTFKRFDYKVNEDGRMYKVASDTLETIHIPL